MAAHRVALVTDSTCNIPHDLVQQYDIRVIPQHLIWGADDLLDLVDIDAATFYLRLARDPTHPKTSQPPVSEFLTLFEQLRAEGAQEIVCLTISTRLSGTYASAIGAKEMIDLPVQVYDSRAAGMGLGWQVIAAARAREAGGDAVAMLDAAEYVRTHMAMVLTVDTLEYLYKGGRIGAAQRILGTALNLKPQLIINAETGIIEPGERTRTRRKAIEAMWNVFSKSVDTSKPLHVAVHHAAARQEALELENRLREEYRPVELFTNELTPVVGTHAGPGTLAIAGYYES